MTICTILGIAATLFIINYAIGLYDTNTYLKREWYNDGDDDTALVSILEFDDDTITYRCETEYSSLNRTFRTWPYKVIGKIQF